MSRGEATVPENGKASRKANLKRNTSSSSDDEHTYSSIKKIKLGGDGVFDSTETIKNIQAFIALGSADESFLDSNDSGDDRRDGKINISELKRTLQGLDGSHDGSDDSGNFVGFTNDDMKIPDCGLKNASIPPNRSSEISQSQSESLPAAKELCKDKTSNDSIVKSVLTHVKESQAFGYQVSGILKKGIHKPQSPESSETSRCTSRALAIIQRNSIAPRLRKLLDSNEFCKSIQEEFGLVEKNALPDKVGRFSYTKGKLTLELKKNEDKKVVRIAVPPKICKNPRACLGPDIKIKRVKKTSIPENKFVPEDPPSTGRLVEEVQWKPKLLPRMAEVDSRVKISTISLNEGPVKKLRKQLVKMQKKIDKTGSVEKSDVVSVKYVHLPQASGTNDALTGDVDNVDESRIKLRGTELGNKSVEKSPRGRKPKNPCVSKKKTRRKSAKNEDVSESSSSSDLEQEEEEVEEENIFDSFFITRDRLIEHHDSLDSDSSSEFETDIYSHFINLNRQKTKREASVYDLMNDISIELPTWNIHASSRGDTFYLVQIDGDQDKPHMKKVIMLDLDNNAKVYVDNKMLPQYSGRYNTYEEIRKLIYEVDQTLIV